jgi:hypothetical protein
MDSVRMSEMPRMRRRRARREVVGVGVLKAVV